MTGCRYPTGIYGLAFSVYALPSEVFEIVGFVGYRVLTKDIGVTLEVLTMGQQVKLGKECAPSGSPAVLPPRHPKDGRYANFQVRMKRKSYPPCAIGKELR